MHWRNISITVRARYRNRYSRVCIGWVMNLTRFFACKHVYNPCQPHPVIGDPEIMSRTLTPEISSVNEEGCMQGEDLARLKGWRKATWFLSIQRLTRFCCGAERVRGTAPVTGGSILFTGLTGDGRTGDGRERLSPLLSRDLQAPSGKHKEISPDGLVQTCQFYFAWFCFINNTCN